MNFLSYFARVSRVAALGAVCSVGFSLPVAAQDARVATRSSELAWRSADRTAASATAPFAPAARTTAPSGWKAVLVGGNHLIDSYNNAATDLGARLQQGGVSRVAVLHSFGEQASGSSARRREMRRAFSSLGAGEACLFFITSHANQRGVYLSAERGWLTPRELSGMVDDECGNRPTVLIISGCNTGSFISSALKADNRIIITASASDRVSYGATTTDRYVNFDRCLIKAMDGGARTWREVFDRALPCVSEREAALGVAASKPQAWFGTSVAHLEVPGRL
jgi:hypothetical protein